MITSQQVSQGMALQQQQHAMLTAGASGMMQAQPAIGMSQYPPQFSYSMPSNPSMTRSGTGGSMVMGGMAGAVNAASSVANMVSMPSGLAGLGMMGTGVARWAGVGGLGGVHAGLGAAAGGLGTAGVLIGGAALMGGTAAAMNAGMRQTNQVNQLMGGMQFANMGGDPRTGRGFSQNDLGTIQRGIQSIGSNNPFVSMTDALRSAERFTDMGMHQGVQDAEKLAKKIKEMGKTMHQMARIMGTTMEEAGQSFGAMRTSGFYSASDVMGNTASMNVMRGYGMTSDQFAGMQAGGAATTRGAQLSGQAGAGFVTGAAQDIMAGIKSGALSGTQIMDITGGRNALEASQIMAQQSLGATMQGLSGSGGTAILAAMGAMKDGRYTGGIDAGLMRQGAMGKFNYHDITEKGAAKIGSGRNAQASFVVNQKDIMDSALKSSDASDMLLNVIRAQAKEQFGEGEDYVELMAQTQFNMDRRQFRILTEMANKRKQGHRARIAEAKRETDVASRAAHIRENRTLGGALQRATGGAADIWQQVAVAPMAEFNRDLVEGFQGLERKLYGDAEVSVSAAAIRDVVLAGTESGAALSKVGPVAAARHAMSTGNLSAYTGTLEVSDKLLGEVKELLPEINKGARAAMSSARGGRLRRLGVTSSDRLDKLEALRKQVQHKVPHASASEIDAIIAKSGEAGARLVTQAKSQTTVGQDLGRKIFGGGSGAADATIASQEHLESISGLDESMSEVLGLAGMGAGLGMAIAGVAIGAGIIAAPIALTAFATAAISVSLAGGGIATGVLGVTGLFGDSDLDDMREEFTSGKAGTELVAAYAGKGKQEKIDKIIADANVKSSTKKEGYALAAKRLTKVLKRPISARDVEIADTIMEKKTKKNAAERSEGLSSEESSAMAEVAKASKSFVGKEATRRVLGVQSDLGLQLSDLDVDESVRVEFDRAVKGLGAGDDPFSNMASAIGAAARGGLTIGEGASNEMQIFGLGVTAYQDLTGASSGGLTMEEMAKVTGYSEEDVKTILGSVGVEAVNGTVMGSDISKVKGALASRMVTGTLAEGAEGVQRVLDSGKTSEQITRESVRGMATAVQQTVEVVAELHKTVLGKSPGQISSPDGLTTLLTPPPPP